MDITGLKPHELARVVQDEMAKLVPVQNVIDECVEEMLCLVEDDEVRRLLNQPQGSVQRLQ